MERNDLENKKTGENHLASNSVKETKALARLLVVCFCTSKLPPLFGINKLFVILNLQLV